ncbi:MAG: LacI family DNA-binding transcriptional regulator [Chthoniobacteraceae bacterium]
MDKKQKIIKSEAKGGINEPDGKINQQYIADQLGISRTTVSRCFTNHAGINPVTRAKVFDVASKLGYQHMETRTPSTRKSSVPMTRVGVLVCTELEEYFRPDYESPGVKLFAGVSELAQLRNVKIDLRYVDPKDDSMSSPSYHELVPLQKREWDGVILIYPFPRAIVDEIHRNFPTVSLVEQYGTAAFNCVDVDHYKGIATLINQLIALGHERIGFYTKRYEVEAEWSLRRYSAYVEKMTRRGSPLNDDDIVNVNPRNYVSLEESFDIVAKRIEAGVTAWLCAADHQAYDLIAALEKRGIRVPQDVSITGFDGIQKPDWAPLLTTTVIPYWEIGYTGGRRLLDIMKKRSGSAQHILISSQIREGETIGPVKKN